MPLVTGFAHDIDVENRSLDAVLAELAVRQQGLVAYWQLIELGFGRGAIEHRVATKRLHRMLPGVYAVGHAVVSRDGWLMAAVLMCGSEAVLSHSSALELRGIIRPGRFARQVTVPGSGRESRAGVIVHQTRRLHPEDHGQLQGIPVMAVPRALLGFASQARHDELVRSLEQCQRLRLFDAGPIDDLLGRSRGRPGVRALRAALAELADDAPDVKSTLERDFLAFCRRRGLPEPALNVSIEGYMVDAAWPSRKVVVELDTYGYHGGKRTFDSDRKRDTKLQAAGQRVVRVTDRRLKREPDDLEADLRLLLPA
jgi:very-short-patch-repair endonuclease